MLWIASFALVLNAADAQELLNNRKLGAANSTNAGESSRLPASSIVLGVVSVAVVVILLLLAAITFLKQRFFSSSASSGTSNSSSSLLVPSAQPVEFSLKEIISVTNNFSDRIGTGLIGPVHRGLVSSTPLAVRKLSSFSGSDREFRSWVAKLGSISHPAIVSLHGFCCDGVARLLVYELLPNGSLDKVLFEGSARPGWDFRRSAALSIATGIEHLHRHQVIHGNIKSENILLDSSFGVKLSDAGLGLLVDRRRLKSAMSPAGVQGYLSPGDGGEVTMMGDVFGFGILLLEMIAGRRVMDLSRGSSEEWNLAEWTRKQVKQGSGSGIVDPGLESDEIHEKVASAIDVALCCIQHDSGSRPSMSKVVEMLNASI